MLVIELLAISHSAIIPIFCEIQITKGSIIVKLKYRFCF